MNLASRKSLRHAAAFAAAFAMAGAHVPAFAAARAGSTAQATTPPSPEAVQALITSIDAQVAKIGATGSVDDYQGSIAFAVDQSKYECNVVSAAIRALLARQSKNKALIRALRNVLDNCGATGTGGTGGIGGNQGGFSGLGFGPSVGGGGSTNYSNP